MTASSRDALNEAVGRAIAAADGEDFMESAERYLARARHAVRAVIDYCNEHAQFDADWPDLIEEPGSSAGENP